jgi:indole-3-glycerol phosphate synthase
VILDEIIKRTKEDLKKRKVDMPIDVMARSLSQNPFPPRPIIPYLTSTPDNPYRIIAEVKKASPSKGVIRENFDHIAIAQAYEQGGADALSILTEPHYFQGNIEYITHARRYVPTPLLRKDFIVDEYQVVEAVAYNADFLLLIAKALTQQELKHLLEVSRQFGMEPLVEIHDKEDLKKAIYVGAQIIGINHRNLETFEMDMTLTEKLMGLIPNSKVIVAESGIETHETVKNLSSIGVDAFLVGEHFMRQDDITLAVKKLKGLA